MQQIIYNKNLHIKNHAKVQRFEEKYVYMYTIQITIPPSFLKYANKKS